MDLGAVFEAFADNWETLAPLLYVEELEQMGITDLAHDDYRSDEALGESLASLLIRSAPADISFDPYILIEEQPDTAEQRRRLRQAAQRLRSLAQELLEAEDITLDRRADALEALAVAELQWQSSFVPGSEGVSRGLAIDEAIHAFTNSYGFTQVASVLGSTDDPLGAASWWLSPNSWLRGVPIDVAQSGRGSEVLFAALQSRNDGW